MCAALGSAVIGSLATDVALSMAAGYLFSDTLTEVWLLETLTFSHAIN